MPDAATDNAVGPSSTTVTAPAPPPVATTPTDISAQRVQAAPQPQAPPQPNPQQVAAVQDVAHHAALGRAFKNTVMGSHTEYQQTPQGPVPQDVPNKPGQLFRSILAGALYGMGAGSDKHTFAQGFGKGAAAGADNAKQVQEQQRQQAQQQFQNSLAAKKEQREEQSSADEHQLHQANMAMHNLQIIRENQQIQGTDYNFHKQVGEDGKTQFDAILKAGVKPAYTDVSESEQAALQKSNPDAFHKYQWFQTGTKVTVDDKGTPHYEATYSAVDPANGSVVTKDQLSNYKKVGLDKAFPEFADVLKEGKRLDAKQTQGLYHAYQELYNSKLEQQKQELGVKKEQSEIFKNNATAAHELVETSKGRLDLKQSAQLEKARDALDKVGGDMSKISAGDRLLLGESATKTLSVIRQELKDARDANDTDRVRDLTQQFDTVSRAVTGAFANPQAAPVGQQLEKAMAALKTAGLTPEQQMEQINSSTLLSADEKKQAIQQIKDAAAPYQNQPETEEPLGQPL